MSTNKSVTGFVTHFSSIRMVRESFKEDKMKEANRENSHRLAIRYEVLVLEALRERSIAIFQSTHADHINLDVSMTRRVKKLFESALSIYGANLSWWYEYFRFLVKSHLYQEMSDKISELIIQPVCTGF